MQASAVTDHAQASSEIIMNATGRHRDETPRYTEGATKTITLQATARVPVESAMPFISWKKYWPVYGCGREREQIRTVSGRGEGTRNSKALPGRAKDAAGTHRTGNQCTSLGAREAELTCTEHSTTHAVVGAQRGLTTGNQDSQRSCWRWRPAQRPGPRRRSCTRGNRVRSTITGSSQRGATAGSRSHGSNQCSHTNQDSTQLARASAPQAGMRNSAGLQSIEREGQNIPLGELDGDDDARAVDRLLNLASRQTGVSTHRED